MRQRVTLVNLRAFAQPDKFVLRAAAKFVGWALPTGTAAAP